MARLVSYPSGQRLESIHGNLVVEPVAGLFGIEFDPSPGAIRAAWLIELPW